MDARERLDDDGDAAEVARLERRVLAAAALAVVVVADDDPGQARLFVLARRVRHAAKAARQHVVHLRRACQRQRCTCLRVRALTTPSLMVDRHQSDRELLRTIARWHVHGDSAPTCRAQQITGTISISTLRD